MAKEEENEDNEEEGFPYRKRSLEKLKVADKVDQLFLPVKTYPKLIWITILFLIFCGIVWLFAGSLPVIVYGRGILISSEGLYTIEAKTKGIVKKIFVKPGDAVYPGQLVAQVENLENEVRYKNAVDYVNVLKGRLAALKKQVGKESLAEKDAIRKQIESSQLGIIELQKTIATLEKDLKGKENLYNQKLIGLNELQESRQLLDRYKIELETTKATQATLQANLKKMYRLQEIKEKERTLLEALHDMEILKFELNYNNIYSPAAGTVLELIVNPGDNVQPGASLAHLEYVSGGNVKRVFYGFVPIDDGKKIRKGGLVDIELSNVSTQDYGTMFGTVIEISPYGVSKENLSNVIQNENLVNFLLKDEKAVTQIVIEPILDPHTVSGYKWSSGNGPAIQISTGTVCKIKMIAGRIRPVLYLFSLGKLQNLKNKIDDFFGIEHYYYRFEPNADETH